MTHHYVVEFYFLPRWLQSVMLLRVALVRKLPKWLAGEAEDTTNSTKLAVATYVVDDCQLKLVGDNDLTRKASVMNVMNICQTLHLCLHNGTRKSLRVPTPLSSVCGGTALEMLRSFSAWQVLSVWPSDSFTRLFFLTQAIWNGTFQFYSLQVSIS